MNYSSVHTALAEDNQFYTVSQKCTNFETVQLKITQYQLF